MIKFNYTNSAGELSEYEAIPLTSELYSDLLNSDRNFLTQVRDEKIEEFKNDENFKKVAEQMLKSHGLGKDKSFNIDQRDGMMLFVTNKRTISAATTEPKIKKTTKQILRSKFSTSNIRFFKTEKMQFNV